MVHSIGKKLRSIRRDKGLNQEAVAAQVGISVPAYSKIEAGVTDITLSRLTQITHALGLSLKEALCHGEPVHQSVSGRLVRAKALLREREEEIRSLQKKLTELLEERKIRKARAGG